MTDKYAVIGNPISHSKSPLIHKIFAEQTGQDMSYVSIPAPLDGFAATIEDIRAAGFRGCNVTVPFKFEAYRLSESLSERAQIAQAVNTLKLDDVIIGDNTDGIGLVRDILHNWNFPLDNRRVLLMGAGGAAYGVILPLLESGVVLTVANRTPEKARQLGAAFPGQITTCDYADLKGNVFDCIINATSSGLSNEMPPLPTMLFAPGALAYEMMYGRETLFLRYAMEQGAAHLADGLGMLVEQAAEAFFIWRGVRPDAAQVIGKLREAASALT